MLAAQVSRAHAPSPARAVVVGTAGHIDHGKTTLVRALTGVDTDRLPEEKRRGITIELGFAPWRIADDVEASIVDVPGHEAFVRTMVAGAGGIDVVMLVVSTEDGVMPQTREHIAVCRLLGVTTCVVALTKIDRLGGDADSIALAIELATDDVRSALADGPYRDAAIVPCSATTGEGIDALRRAVLGVVAKLPRRDATSAPILPIDRVFTIKGHGTVVTGTLLAGAVDVRKDEDYALVRTGGRAPRTVRARAAQVRTAARDRVVAGNRLALNLAIDLDAIARGDVLTRGPWVAAQSSAHVRLHHLPGASATWRRGTTLELCAGTAHASATLDPLWLVPAADTDDDDKTIAVAPGREALVRVRLGSPLPLWAGQRVVLRAFGEPGSGAGPGAGRTVGGGVVVDPQPSSGRAQRARWIALGRAMDGADAATRTATLVDDAGVAGITTDELLRRSASRDAPVSNTELVELPGARWVHDRWLRPLVERVIAIVDRFHAANPLLPGMGRAALEGSLGVRVDPHVAAAAIDRAIARGTLRSIDEQGALARPGKGLQRGGELPGHGKAILELYVRGGITPPTLREVGEATGLGPRDVLELVTALHRLGKLVKIGAELSIDIAAHDDLLAKTREHLATHGTIDVQALKGLTGLTRKFAVPWLEHLDALGVTLRAGDVRKRGPKA
jgi:selenocysteine-specific elongation factor